MYQPYLQPEFLTANVIHLFVNRELILGNGRDWLWLRFINPVVDRNMAPADSDLFESDYFTKRYTGYVTADP